MRDNSGFRVKDGTATLATRLKAAGFATGAFVGGFPLTKRFGLTPGFDVYDDQMPELEGDIAFSMPERRADEVVARAVDWIGKTHESLLRLGARVRSALAVQAAGRISPRPTPQQPYYGEVAFVDRALGPLFDRLATLSRPTLVIVTADHGESLGEHGELTHGMFAYEATLRVPLIVAQGRARAARAPSQRRRHRHAGAPRRHRADRARGGRRGGGRTVRGHVAAGGRSRGPRRRPAGLLRVDDLQPRARLGAAARRARQAGQVHRPADPGALRPGRRSERGAEPRAAAGRARAGDGQHAAHLQRRAAGSARAGNRPRSRPRCDRSATSRAARRSARSTPRPTTRRTSSHVDRDLHTASELYQDGQGPGGDRAAQRRDRPPAGHGGRLHLAGARLLGVRPAAAGDRRRSRKRWPTARRTATCASGSASTSPRARPIPHAPSSCSRACRSDDVEALNGLGVAYGGAGRYADAIRGVQAGAGARPDQRPRVPEPGVDGAAPGAGGKERRRPAKQAAGGRAVRAPGARHGSVAARGLHDPRRRPSQNPDGRARRSTAGSAPSRSTAASSTRSTT